MSGTVTDKLLVIRALERFRQEVLNQADEFSGQRSTTIEEARGAEVIADLIRNVDVEQFAISES
jgi:hypothetical protein